MASRIFKDSIDSKVDGYKVVLSYKSIDPETGDIMTKYAELDVQDGAKEVKSNVELTSFPTMMHHNISDHIYRQPIEVSLKGSFSEDGLKATNWVGTDRLTAIQSEFEACQRAGVKFNIVTIRDNDMNNESSKRFITRENMVLTGISWSELQNTVNFNFNFKEALSSNLKIENSIESYTDPNLPPITDLEAASLVGELISSDQVISMIIEILQNLNLVNDATFNRCAAIGVVAETTSISIVIGLIAAAGTSAAAGPIGWVVGIGIALVAGVIAVFEFWQANERQKEIDRYKALGHYFIIEDDMSEKEKDKIARQFVDFLVETKQAIDDSLKDIAVYRIGKTDRQECVLMLNGNYYILQIEINNDTQEYSVKCYYNGDTLVATREPMIGLNSFDDCDNTSSSVFFYDLDDKRYRAYIINRASYLQTLKGETTTQDELLTEYASDRETYERSKDALLEIAFVTAPYPLTDLTDKIAEIIKQKVG